MSKTLRIVRFRIGRTIYRIELPHHADAIHEIRAIGFTHFIILEP